MIARWHKRLDEAGIPHPKQRYMPVFATRVTKRAWELRTKQMRLFLRAVRTHASVSRGACPAMDVGSMHHHSILQHTKDVLVAVEVQPAFHPTARTSVSSLLRRNI